jgi:prepilin-type N-terminal cleavage/methylation domain-containing protein
MKNRGFTLVEMIVSLAIFAVVAVIAVGALLKVIDANKKAQSIQSSITNINFALESISRDIRVGTDYTCGNSSELSTIRPEKISSFGASTCAISNGNRYIAFNSSRVDNVNKCNLITIYAFMPDLEKAEQQTCNDTSYSFNDLISPTDISLTDHELGVLYKGSGYPMFFIRMAGYAGIREQDRTYVDVETAVSGRSQQ